MTTFSEVIDFIVKQREAFILVPSCKEFIQEFERRVEEFKKVLQRENANLIKRTGNIPLATVLGPESEEAFFKLKA